MTILNGILGTLYFFHIGTIGYWTNYPRHLIWREKCRQQWNDEQPKVDVKPKAEDKPVMSN